MRAYLVLPLLILPGCVVESPVVADRDDDGSSRELGVARQEARVTSEEAALALVVASSTQDYLPYGYADDGCYARALYMSMELAARRIPSTSQFINGWLFPKPNLQWSYHVAPMLELEETKQRVVLDPALAPTGPISLEEWIQRTGPKGKYELEWTLGNEFASDLTVRRNHEATPVIQSFAEMGTFNVADISDACQVMVMYLGFEGTTAAERAKKRELLLLRTRTLAGRLAELGKLDKALTPSIKLCGPVAIPACVDVTQSCSDDGDCCSNVCTAGVCAARVVDGIADAGVLTVDGGAWVTADGGVDGGVPAETILQNAVPTQRTHGAEGSVREYRLDVPATAKSLRVELSGGSGDADLYVRFGAPASFDAWDHRPLRPGNNEVVSVSPVQAGAWYVGVIGYDDYFNVQLTATYLE